MSRGLKLNEGIGYRETYRIRRTFPDKKFTEVTLPYKVVEKEARKRELSFDEFIKRFQVVAEYDNFEGVRYTFEEIPSESKEPDRVG